ncbi:MAG: hypothetical protein R3C14_19700 [Caldilineaceae bacterium]
MDAVQYITDEQGKRTGVVLAISEYQRLIHPTVLDKELLTGLSQAELQALATCVLASKEQNRLDDLLARNTNAQLSAAEMVELDQLLEEVDQLNVLKTRAHYTLAQQEQIVN